MVTFPDGSAAPASVPEAAKSTRFYRDFLDSRRPMAAAGLSDKSTTDRVNRKHFMWG
jgi:hypothetical protein